MINGCEPSAKHHRLKPEQQSQGAGDSIAGGNKITREKPTNSQLQKATWVSGKCAFSLMNDFVGTVHTKYCHTLGLFMANLKFHIMQI